MKPDNIKQLLNIHNDCGTPSQVLMKIVQLYEGLNIEALVEKVPGFPELQGKLIPSVMACSVDMALLHVIVSFEINPP
jgi:hypothetical protein